MTIQEIIRAIQAKEGLTVDGQAGPQTWLAIHHTYFPDSVIATLPPGEQIDPVDERSEKAIATLHATVRPLARALVHAAAEQGITIKVTSGTRTYAEQNALFAKGGVTKARGGFSNHNFGLAFDVTIFSGTKPVWESPAYKAVGALGVSLGLDWGGNWKSFVDEPHFQLRPDWARDLSESSMLAELRRRHDSGTDAFANA